MVTLSAVIHKEEDMYVAECPEVGTVSQGKTVEKAIKNLKEATELYLEEFPKKLKWQKEVLASYTHLEINSSPVSSVPNN